MGVTIVILLREWGHYIMRLFVIKVRCDGRWGKGGKLSTVAADGGVGAMLLPLDQLGLGWLIPVGL